MTTKTHGLIFDAESIRGFISGRKDRTSRVLSPHNLRILDGERTVKPSREFFEQAMNEADNFRMLFTGNGCFHWTAKAYPWQAPHTRTNWTGRLIYSLGDLVYAKEAFEPCPDCVPSDKVHRFMIHYKADGRFEAYNAPLNYNPVLCHHTGMFMPRCFARLWFKIVGLNVQRVQDISEVDAKAEGAQRFPGDWQEETGRFLTKSFVCGFIRRWESINAARGYGWGNNPPVVALKLQRIEPPKNSV